MNIYLVSRIDQADYDEYDSFVCGAPDEDTARNMSPGDGAPMLDWGKYTSGWACSPDLLRVRYLGEAAPGIGQGVLCASFNAG